MFYRQAQMTRDSFMSGCNEELFWPWDDLLARPTVLLLLPTQPPQASLPFRQCAFQNMATLQVEVLYGHDETMELLVRPSWLLQVSYLLGLSYLPVAMSSL